MLRHLDEAPFYTAVIAVALSLGYIAGSKSKPLNQTRPEQEIKGNDTQTHGRDSDSETSSLDGDQNLSTVELLPEDEYKLVLVVRTDLGMSTGKMAAQCSHATLACYKTLLSSNTTVLRRWESSGQLKIALRCSNEEELLTLQAQAQSLNLCARSIQDAGRTQIAAGSRTVLGILGPVRLVNRITGTLRLL
ncbi:hypothetical protein E1B28_001322 [Marasmius oreades]|uniref:peptidyl-tRNA hydrolase n=1 Tax=Marasmius oreades TaxID=181124 RepID=A0A9P7V366_9AGAR|nr:uncharacterized protein E1B28_001322 [Marasmius oreades]KAG7099473.1 hypothetical protein E1B28_001322 [Marasmius oreades]